MSGALGTSGNPYAAILNSNNQKTAMVNQWSRTGFRRGLSNYPWFVDAKSGEIVVSERDGHRLQIFDCAGNETRFEPFGSCGQGRHQFRFPGGVTTSSQQGANIICADTGNSRVVLFSIGSDFHGNGILKETGSFGQQLFRTPSGVELDTVRQYLVVTDPGSRRVTLHGLRTGEVIGEMRPHPSCPLLNPVDVTLDDMGHIYVTDANAHCIHVFQSNGDFMYKIGEPGTRPGEFNKPWGLCFDRKFNLLVADEGNNRVQMLTPDSSRTYWKPSVVTNEVYLPKGVSVNVHENLVVTTGDPLNFIKIFRYGSSWF